MLVGIAASLSYTTTHKKKEKCCGVKLIQIAKGQPADYTDGTYRSDLGGGNSYFVDIRPDETKDPFYKHQENAGTGRVRMFDPVGVNLNRKNRHSDFITCAVCTNWAGNEVVKKPFILGCMSWSMTMRGGRSGLGRRRLIQGIPPEFTRALARWNNEENQKKYKLNKIDVDWTRRF